MSVLRRIVATFSGLFLLQLMLLGSGTLCVSQQRPSQHASASHAMHQAQAPAHEHHVTGVSGADLPMTPASCDDGQDAGCNTLPSGQCADMAACVILAPPPAHGVPPASRVVAAVVPMPATSHYGPIFAPELPPPRA